jgi:hypothetical protein
MVSLVDIVPQTRPVTLSIGTVELRGLGLRHIADLLVRFPELRKLWTNGAPALDVDTLIEAAPDAVGAIIAIAASQPEAAETIGDALSLDDAAECLIAIRELTMPGGVDPFVERLSRLLGADVSLSGRDQDTNTPPPPSSSSHAATAPAT